MATTARPKPSLLLVAYGWSPKKAVRLAEFCRDFIPLDQVLVVRNDQGGPDSGYREVRGSNIYAEFSGYIEGLRSSNFEGPLIVANDTLLTHRATRAWRKLLQNFELPVNHIFGDFRMQDLDEVQLPMLASWLFYLPGATHRVQFQQALNDVAEHWGQSPYGASYQAVVDRYLQGGWFRGWIHAGRRCPEDVALKRNCIYAEHRLSILLGDAIYRPNDQSLRLEQCVHRINRQDRWIAFQQRVRAKLRQP